MSETEFSPGDWIIASQPRIDMVLKESSILPAIEKDFAFMNCPIRVHTVTPSHIIYDQGDDTTKNIISQYEIKERGFVVADEAIVSLLIL